ncbi:MAG TPA: zinc ribbon domain-containing protein [Longimicrobiales bacterium]
MDTLILVLIAVLGAGAVLAPLFSAGRGARRPAGIVPALDDEAIDREVARYREAVRADTVCGRCRYANPAGSRFCADCGTPLPAASGGA